MINLFRRRQEPAEDVPPDLGPMPSIFEQPKPPPVALVAIRELLPPLWRMGGPDGTVLADTLRFLSDGRVLGSADERLRRWELAGGTLIVGPADGEPFAVFDGRTTRRRRELLTGAMAGLAGEVWLAANHDDMVSVNSLSRPSGPVLVAFNSGEHPFDGRDYPAWEFEDCVAASTPDFVMFAERNDPSFWFLNKTGRVLDRLRQLPGCGYRDIVFVGQSSGGFAAMLFAELLSYEFHDCRIRSVTVNPQTTHGAEHECRVRAAAPPAMLPPLVEPDTLTQKDCGVADIRELVRMSTRRRGELIAHRVLFDDGNPAESYQARAVGDLRGFHLAPATLGLPHAEGVAALRGSAAFGDALGWGLDRLT